MPKIKISEENVGILKPYVERQKNADYAFQRASHLARTADSALWEKIWEFYPSAKRVDFPDDGDWHVLVDQDEQTDQCNNQKEG
jgi:hypothetical protein